MRVFIESKRQLVNLEDHEPFHGNRRVVRPGPIYRTRRALPVADELALEKRAEQVGIADAITEVARSVAEANGWPFNRTDHSRLRAVLYVVSRQPLLARALRLYDRRKREAEAIEP